MDRPDLLYSVKRTDAENGFTTHPRPHGPQESCTDTQPMTCRYRWTELDSNIEVFGDANVAGCNSTRKSTVVGVAMWSGQFVTAWSTTVGVLALSSGEFELAAVVRAAKEGMGLQSILNDFCLCGHVAMKSDATAAIVMVHRFGLGKVRHLAARDLWVQHHGRSGENSSLQTVRTGECERRPNQVSWARTIAAPYESV